MARNYKKEGEWDSKVYKRLVFKCRTDNGELERLQGVLKNRTFADWVREKLAEDEREEGSKVSDDSEEYTPACPLGRYGCTNDPAYIKVYDPDKYRQLFGDLEPGAVVDIACPEEKRRLYPESKSCWVHDDK